MCGVGTFHSVKLSCLDVEHAELVGGEFGEPQPALVVEHGAARPRARGRRRIDGAAERLGVDAPDVLVAEIHEVQIVVGVGDHAIGRMLAVGADRHALERIDDLVLAGREIEPQDRMAC